jgi:hypothetical protein
MAAPFYAMISVIKTKTTDKSTLSVASCFQNLIEITFWAGRLL